MRYIQYELIQLFSHLNFFRCYPLNTALANPHTLDKKLREYYDKLSEAQCISDGSDSDCDSDCSECSSSSDSSDSSDVRTNLFCLATADIVVVISHHLMTFD